MNNKSLKAIITFLQFLVSVVLTFLCVTGLRNTVVYEYRVKFIESILRIISLLVLTVFYYRSLTGKFGTDTLFIPLHFFFSVLSEIRILSDYAKLFNICFVTPSECVNIFIFSNLMSILPLIGYYIFYNTDNPENSSRFTVAIIAGSIFLTMLIPKAQNIQDLFMFKTFNAIIYAIYAFTVVACIIVLVTDAPGFALLKHILVLILVGASYINLKYEAFILNVVITALVICVTAVVIIMTRRNSVRL